MNMFIFTYIYRNIWMDNKYLNVFYGETDMSFIYIKKIKLLFIHMQMQSRK